MRSTGCPAHARASNLKNHSGCAMYAASEAKQERGIEPWTYMSITGAGAPEAAAAAFMARAADTTCASDALQGAPQEQPKHCSRLCTR